MTTALELVAVALIVAANAFFVAAEYGLVTVRRTRMQELDAQGSRGARRVLRLLEQPPRFISAIQLGVTLSSLALGAIGEPVVSRLLERPLDLLPESWHTSVATTISVILAFTILTYFHVVMGEIVPKSFTLQHPERVAVVAAGPIGAFYVIFRPFIWVLVRTSGAVLGWFGVTASSGITLVHSEEELKMLVTASREKGVLEEDEQEMLHKVFEFADKDAVDVMVPRPDVVAVPVDLPVQDVLALVLSHPFTRYPVFEGDLDDVVGVLHVRDLFSTLHERGLESTNLRMILREAIMVPETKPLDELLAEFQRTSNHLAIVVDEYGSVEGLVTLEDLLEEIVGEIGDEFDLPDAGVLRIGRGRVRLVGSFPIEEFNERFGKSLPVDDYHTIGGFVFGELGRVPRVGDIVAFDGARFEVSAIDGPRIREVDVTLTATASQTAQPPGQSGE
ncbi:MAG TPA: hemolysin family protein [Gaiellales bacterium]|jgi:CBS domain containing-hemolysin-like protein|nr:hemolysin family protein [Gaiellales bacterium]